MLQDPLIGLAAVIVLGVGAQWLAWRIRMPSILMLLLAGVLVGPVARQVSEAWSLNPDALFGEILLPLVSLAVALILYEGGLTLTLRELRGATSVVWKLVTIGALVTGAVAALGAWAILGLPFSLAILLGAILTVSGPTVVIPLLGHVRPKGKVGPILKWEGIVIDPIGAMLAVLVFEGVLAAGPEEAVTGALVDMVKTVVVGGGAGLLGAWVLVALLRRYLIPDALQNPVSLMIVTAAFAVSNAIQGESGLFAATTMGIALANQRAANIERIIEFKENLRVLLLAGLFILLGARLTMDQLATLGPPAIAFTALLVLVARPLSVLASTYGAALDRKEKLFLAWMAPRGVVAAAVASVFALQMKEHDAEGAEVLVPLTFGVIVGTVLVYGLTSPLVARRLGLADQNPQGMLILGAHPWARQLAAAVQRHGHRVLLVDTNRENVAAARLEGLDAYNGSILSDRFLGEINLIGIGRLLALTPNDEVNTLAVRRMERFFGRAEVYQLSPAPRRRERDEPDEHLLGRMLWSREATFDACDAMWNDGATIKSTTLTAKFSLEDFREVHGADAIPMLVINESGRLQVVAAGTPVDAKGGQTIVAMVRRKEETEGEAGAAATAGADAPPGA